MLRELARRGSISSVVARLCRSRDIGGWMDGCFKTNVLFSTRAFVIARA